ncbi:FAD-dependent monooxygenase [Ideonella sp. A 288]|uniref:FAD-dependent monooxygenase n=1 Tax=Ideonella sp. A 288 TaxID=1962181 RepID=UPI000B4BE6C6|nr:FAD-dependent monooxygenase [Ideonella sp. A 288]
MTPQLDIAVIGAGPAGLALALHAARLLPAAHITLFDARPADKDVAGDPRTLAMSLGSVQLLQRLDVWPADLAQPILQVHVSQAPPTLDFGGGEPAVRIRAIDEAVPMLGAVLSYGQLVAPMQAAWQAAVAREPQRLASRFGTAVAVVKPLDDGGVEVDAGVVERFDLAVVAEGGVFSDQSRKAVTHDYKQAAWVGTVMLEGAVPGLAVERFTRNGPLALLPLRPDAEGRARGSMVWCVGADDDPVAELDDAQRLAVLATRLPAEAGRVVALGPLKRFALGLNAERTLVDGCTVRIGNAAQTLHPVAGQGLNLGLRDAFSLVQALRRVDAPGDAALRAALRRVEWARAPDRWAMIAATDFLARSFTWRWPGLPAVRGLGLAALQSMPALKSALARQMMYGRR